MGSLPETVKKLTGVDITGRIQAVNWFHFSLQFFFIIFKAFLFNFLYRCTLHLDSIQICNDNLFRKMYCCRAFCYHCFKEILSPHINLNCFAPHANCALWIQRQFITGFSRDLGKICWRGGEGEYLEISEDFTMQLLHAR